MLYNILHPLQEKRESHDTNLQKHIYQLDALHHYIFFSLKKYVLCCSHTVTNYSVPYFGKRKQVTYHPKSELFMFLYIQLPSVLFFQAKFYASTLILLRGRLGKIFHCVSGNDRHILLFDVSGSDNQHFYLE